MPRVALDLPTHQIHVPSGRSSERYYIPIRNIPYGGARELVTCWLQDCGVTDWQFHNDARSGWVCFGHETGFENALKILQDLRQVHPRLEFSAINKRNSFKLEVIDCTACQPRFARLWSSHVKGHTRHGSDLIDWIRLDLPKVHVKGTQRILMAGLSVRPNIHELNQWMRWKLGLDCLLIATCRMARIGACRALVVICTLAMTNSLTVDKISNLLGGAMFGRESVRVVVERLDGDVSATTEDQEEDEAPLVVLGSSKLPSEWLNIVSRWNSTADKNRKIIT